MTSLSPMVEWANLGAPNPRDLQQSGTCAADQAGARQPQQPARCGRRMRYAIVQAAPALPWGEGEPGGHVAGHLECITA